MPDSLDPQGPVAEAIADLWWIMLALGVAVFVLFLVLLGRSLLRQSDPTGDDTGDEQHLVRRWIGIGGIAMPAAVICVVFAATLVSFRDITQDAPAGALEIEVVGHQFWYEVRYPGSGLVTANELHLPTGRQVALRLESSDVIHGFWVPALGGKLDMLPGHTNTLVLQADEPGVHRSRCSEFCGLQHAKMALVVVAEPPDRFDSWMREQLALPEPTAGPARRGEQVFVERGCAKCHARRGALEHRPTGPDLTTLPSRRMLAAATMPNTVENLAAWIRDPGQFKEGVSMPGADLDDDELDALLAYLGMGR